MSQQPELTSSALPATPATAPPGATVLRASESGTSTPHPDHPRIPRWLEQAELFLRVLMRMCIGMVLFCAPWSRTLWDQNPFLAHFPSVANLAAHGAVRGIISGLGLLNLWIAFRDAIRHRDG